MSRHAMKSQVVPILLSLILIGSSIAHAQTEPTSSTEGETVYLPFVSSNGAAVDVDAAAVSNKQKVAPIEDEKGTGYPDSRKMVCDTGGNCYVAIRKKDSQGQLRIYVYKRVVNSTTWSVTNDGKPIDANSTSTQRVPSIAIDGNNVLHIVWYGPTAGANPDDDQIRYARSTNLGASFVDKGVVAQVNGFSSQSLWQEHPTISIAANNAIYIVWEGHDNNYYSGTKGIVKFVKSADGGNTWLSQTGNPVLPDDANLNIMPTSVDQSDWVWGQSTFSRPTLVTDPSNSSKLYLFAYATNSKYSGNKTAQIIWTQSVDSGKNWSGWQLLRHVSGLVRDQRHVSADVGSNGIVHVVWRQEPESTSKGTKPQIHYSTLQNGTWATPVMPKNQSSVYQFFPSITVTPANVVWVVWNQTPDSSGYDSLTNSYSEAPITGNAAYIKKSSSGWGSLGAASEDRAIYPSLRRFRPGDTGSVDIVWLRWTGTNLGEVWVAKLS